METSSNNQPTPLSVQERFIENILRNGSQEDQGKLMEAQNHPDLDPEVKMLIWRVRAIVNSSRDASSPLGRILG